MSLETNTDLPWSSLDGEHTLFQNLDKRDFLQKFRTDV
jgi:hypothetical protein